MARVLGCGLLAAGLALACARFGRGRSEHGRAMARSAGATPVGDEACLACHEDVGTTLAETVHREALGCETCHGPGGRHVDDPQGPHIGTFDDLHGMSTWGQAEMCLSCHKDMTSAWSRSGHAGGQLACAMCHSDVVHWQVERAVDAPGRFEKDDRFCDQCHRADTLGFQQVYRHPVGDVLSCGRCHAVHGEQDRREDRCGRCHPQQAAPRVFRHAALDEGCEACHAAHGAAVPALLTQQGNSLCLPCHFEPSFPVIEGVDHDLFLAGGARCFDCHVEVHGSNTDPSLLGRLR